MARGEAYDLVQAAARKVWAGEGDLQSHLAADPRVTERLDAGAAGGAVRPEPTTCAGSKSPFARLGLGT